jgi:hypothetical protein
MKKIMLSALFALVLSPVFAQLTSADVFKPEVPVTWLGIDYTQLRFIGSASQMGEGSSITPDQIRDKYFPAWNDLVINEPKKYDVPAACNRASVTNAPEVAGKMNNSTKTDQVFTSDANDFSRLTKEMVAAQVKKYNFAGHKGLGMMLVGESMSKGKEASSYWVVFVDMDTKKVLVAERLEEKAGGFGFRNYWARSVMESLKTSKSMFPSWKKQYAAAAAAETPAAPAKPATPAKKTTKK